MQAMLVNARKWTAFSFVTTVESSASGEPGHRAFDRPAVASQLLGGLDAFAGDAVPDAVLP
ncbi:hypothetical protein JOF35_005105 [Streptomyces demainii]|uniref:Uncharacterized protein n=1 Tax=Streptomyces demainii TaxID=588122 RepID=A0ABT9KWK6_9ACTN|nr:hypothetical protein [Streptomyces demainii]